MTCCIYNSVFFSRLLFYTLCQTLWPAQWESGWERSDFLCPTEPLCWKHGGETNMRALIFAQFVCHKKLWKKKATIVLQCPVFSEKKLKKKTKPSLKKTFIGRQHRNNNTNRVIYQLLTHSLSWLLLGHKQLPPHFAGLQSFAHKNDSPECSLPMLKEVAQATFHSSVTTLNKLITSPLLCSLARSLSLSGSIASWLSWKPDL